MTQPVRVRFAPSPTGPLHIGGVRTALYNFLFARRQGGKVILRIEDTDSSRFVPGAERYIIESFRWLGLHFDEGVGIGGECGPYRQSERRPIYRQYVEQLLQQGKAYYAFDTPDELSLKRQTIPNFQYDASTRSGMRNSLSLPRSEFDKLLASGVQYVVRLKIEPGEDILVHDLIRGDVTINSSILDDKVLFKSTDGLPTYHLANVVDDHLMGITHVIRGEEWLSSAPLHVLLYRALGWSAQMPQFAHLPLLLKPDGKGKLSKRDGDRLGFPVFPLNWTDPKTGTLSAGFREQGYFPEAVTNFLALLGWNDGTDREIFSFDELSAAFDLSRCSKAGAKFDYKKAVWFNHEYILRKSDDELAPAFDRLLRSNGISAPIERVTAVISMMKKRVNFLSELWPMCKFFFVAPTSYDDKTVRKRWKPDSPVLMQQLHDLLGSLDDFSIESQEACVMDWIKQAGLHTGDVMNAFRLALVGEGIGPTMFEISSFLGKDETLRRLDRAIATLPRS